MEKTIPNIKQEYSLKKRLLKRWIYDNNYTQPLLATKLHISTEELKRRLSYEQPFSMEQIRILIKLMGADEAFKVIYFTTYKQRQQVFADTFVKKKTERKCDE